MKIIVWLLCTCLSVCAIAQDTTATLTVYSFVPDSYLADVMVYLNGQSLYPGPLDKDKKLVHTIKSMGKMTLVAKVTNKPGFKSAVHELEIQPGGHPHILVDADAPGRWISRLASS